MGSLALQASCACLPGGRRSKMDEALQVFYLSLN